MYKTEFEILTQYQALRKTYERMMEKQNEIVDFFANTKLRSLTYIGSGSSYSLSKSAALSAKMKLHIETNAIAAGDLLVNFEMYRHILKDTVIVSTSRSGNTSEAVMSIKLAKEKLNVPCISLCANVSSDIAQLADFNFEFPWAFDESVCQTRCITNFYMANLMLLAIAANDKSLLNEIDIAISEGNAFIEKNKPIMKEIAENGCWNKAVVLADGELEGIAEEGALAFNEISQLPSHYYHVLDVRHGPVVLIDSKTLVIMVTSPAERLYQSQLVTDLKNKGAKVVVVSEQTENIWNADYHIPVSCFQNFSVTGIPFIFVPQAVSLYKALYTGINPDVPNGLDPWIKLD